MGFLLTLEFSSESVDHFILFFSKFSCLGGKFFTAVLELLNAALHFVLLLLSHQGLTHSIGDGGLVKGLVSLDGHADFISDTNEEESTLSAVDSDLTNELIKALGVQLFTNGADTSLSGLS